MRIKIINVLSKRQFVDRSYRNAVKNKFESNLVRIISDLVQTNLDLAQINLDFAQTDLDLAQTILDLLQTTSIQVRVDFVAFEYHVQIFLNFAISKKKRDNNNAEDLKKHRSKIVRVITVFTIQDIINKLIFSKYNFVIIDKKDCIADKLFIFVLKT